MNSRRCSLVYSAGPVVPQTVARLSTLGLQPTGQVSLPFWRRGDGDLASPGASTIATGLPFNSFQRLLRSSTTGREQPGLLAARGLLNIIIRITSVQIDSEGTR